MNFSRKLCKPAVKMVGGLDNQQRALLQPTAADGFERCWMKCLSARRPQDDLDCPATVQWDGNERCVAKLDMSIALSDGSSIQSWPRAWLGQRHKERKTQGTSVDETCSETYDGFTIRF